MSSSNQEKKAANKWMPLVLTAGGVVAALALFAGGAVFQQFKHDENIKERHEQVKIPMFMIDDGGDDEDEDAKTQMTSASGTLDRFVTKPLLLASEVLFPDRIYHPCSGDSMTFSKRKVPVEIEIGRIEKLRGVRKFRIKMRLKLEGCFLASSDRIAQGQAHIFQDFEVVKELAVLEGKHEAIYRLNVENYYFPSENFTLFFIHRFELSAEGESLICSCTEARLDMDCNNVTQKKNSKGIALREIQAGSSSIKSFHFPCNLEAKLIPVASRTHAEEGWFHVALSFLQPLQQNPFVLENVSKKDVNFVFISNPHYLSQLQIFSVRIQDCEKTNFNADEKNLCEIVLAPVSPKDIKVVADHPLKHEKYEGYLQMVQLGSRYFTLKCIWEKNNKENYNFSQYEATLPEETRHEMRNTEEIVFLTAAGQIVPKQGTGNGSKELNASKFIDWVKRRYENMRS